MKKIISKNNPFIISVSKLQSVKHRNEEKLFLIEGIKTIEMAQDSLCTIQAIIFDEARQDRFADILNRAAESETNVIEANEGVLDKISAGKSPQGIVAVVEFLRQDAKKQYDKLIVALNGISDPGNLGTIIRTADAVGASAVIVDEDCVDIYNDKAIRASMGSIFNIDIIHSDNLIETISDYKKQGYMVGCGHLHGSNFFERTKQDKTLLVIGNEANGISKNVEDICDCKWKLPMYGKAESFNAAVAAGIMMYDIIRK